MRIIVSKSVEFSANFSREDGMSEVVLKAHSLVWLIAEPKKGEKRTTLIGRALARIRRLPEPAFDRWSERRVRSHMNRELLHEPHRIRQVEIDDLERVAAPIKEKANAAAIYLLDQRARLLSTSDPEFYREQILAIEHALSAMGIVDLSGIKTDDHRSRCEMTITDEQEDI